MSVKESALDTAKTLEALLCALREYANDPTSPREHISLLLSLAYELVDPIIGSIDSVSPENGSEGKRGDSRND